MSFDEKIFRLIHQFTHRYYWLDRVGIFCARFLLYILVGALALLGVATGHLAIFLVPMAAGVFARFMIVEIIYAIYQRPRPPQSLGIAPLIPIPKHPSLPSGHASFLFALSFTLFLFHPGLAWICIATSMVVALARVHVGVHWFSDILVGAGVGFFAAWLLGTVIM